MGWRMVVVRAWVPEQAPGYPSHPIVLPPEEAGPPPGIWPDPGVPTHPIAPGGPPPSVWPGPGYPVHPIAPGGPPPQVWPGPGYPAHPIAPGGEPPGFWGGRPPEWVDTTPPQPPTGQPPGFWGGVAPPWVDTTPPGPQPVPPGIWGGPPSYIDIGGPGPQPPTGLPTHPIYLPPVIWPDQPEGYPSFDPDQIPGHPDLPDLNYGVWSWVDNDGALERCFIAQVVRPGHDLPGYAPNLPPEDRQPGSWVVVLLNPQRPAWGWIPSVPADLPPSADDPHVEHHSAR